MVCICTFKNHYASLLFLVHLMYFSVPTVHPCNPVCLCAIMQIYNILVMCPYSYNLDAYAHGSKLCDATDPLCI